MRGRWTRSRLLIRQRPQSGDNVEIATSTGYDGRVDIFGSVESNGIAGGVGKLGRADTLGSAVTKNGLGGGGNFLHSLLHTTIYCNFFHCSAPGRRLYQCQLREKITHE